MVHPSSITLRRSQHAVLLTLNVLAYKNGVVYMLTFPLIFYSFVVVLAVRLSEIGLLNTISVSVKGRCGRQLTQSLRSQV